MLPASILSETPSETLPLLDFGRFSSRNETRNSEAMPSEICASVNYQEHY
jgi:hypothetical protein